MSQALPPNDDIAELVERVGRAAAAYIRGDIRGYFDLIPMTSDCSLMPPYGGEPAIVGNIRTEEQIEATSRFFHSGEADFEVAQTLVGQDVVVLVAIERQHGKVGEFPDQDWSLRVTLVFVRQDGQWKLAHRHADGLVRPITMDRLAELARGAG
jgi:ketosteroid isomerase-like protein